MKAVAQVPKVRLKDVAGAAGVSQGTASNVFNRPELVAEELRTHVLEVAERLGYAGPQPIARVLRSGKVGLIALLTDESAAYLVSDAYGRRLLAGVARACDDAGVGLTIVGGAAGGETGASWSVETALADGFVLHCFEEDDAIFERIAKRDLPTIAVDSGRRSAHTFVGIDDEAAARQVMDHLIALGHRRIGILTLEFHREAGPGPIEEIAHPMVRYQTTGLRLSGYLRAAEGAGLAADDILAYQTENDEASVACGIDWLMDREDPPTAIAAMSDLIALIAMERLKARDLKIPDDVSVVGFDGVEEGAYTDPPLTTLVQPAEEKGEAAAQMLLGLRPREDLVLPSTLLERQSTAPPGGTAGTAA